MIAEVKYMLPWIYNVCSLGSLKRNRLRKSVEIVSSITKLLSVSSLVLKRVDFHVGVKRMRLCTSLSNTIKTLKMATNFQFIITVYLFNIFMSGFSKDWPQTRTLWHFSCRKFRHPLQTTSAFAARSNTLTDIVLKR